MRRSILDKLQYNSKPIYFRKINITNNENSDLSDYQVCIEINDSNFFEKANPNNILLVENDIVLPYWIEEWKRPSGKVKIWTKLNLKASESKIIYLYYGDDFNISPNGDDVFIFFDDFDGDSLNEDKWGVLSGSISVQNSNVVLDGSDNLHSSISFGSGYIFEARCYATEQDSSFLGLYLDSDNYVQLDNSDADISDNFERIRLHTKKNGSYYSTSSNKLDFRGVHKRYKLKRRFNNVIDGYQEDELVATESSHIIDGNMKVKCSVWNTSQESTLYVDWVFVRKYINNEPTISIESEQQKLIDNYNGIITINSFNGYFTHYKRSIQITNNESSVLNNFQIPIEIDGDFLDKADPNNLIFMDGSTILSYWVEEWGRSSGKAKIWIKTNLTASQIKTIYLYYGGYVSQKPNGDNVFLFFDDFPGISLNSNKWAVVYEVGGGYHSVSNSRLTVGSTGDWSMVGAKSQYSYGHAFEFLASMTEQNNSNIIIVTRSGTTNDYNDMGSIINDGSQRYVTKSGGAQDTHNRSDNISSMKRLTIAYISGHMKYYIDGSLKYDCTNHVPVNKNLGIQFRNAVNGSKTVIDWVAVRKYTINEPSVSVGNESNELRYW